MSDWKAGMAFDSILQTPLDYYDVTYANGNTVRYEKERPHGEWKFDVKSGLFTCSECEGLVKEPLYEWCPWCGLDMRKRR